MTSEDGARDDLGAGFPWAGTWAAAGEEHRIRREILRRVRRDRNGKNTAALAEELRRGFAAAGIPQPPEEVRDWATAIAEHWRPEMFFVGQLVDMAVHRRIPPGMRREERRLPGDRWVPVQLADSATARAAVRRYRSLQTFTEQFDPATPFTARLITMPGPDGEERIAVLLGSSFAGTVPQQDAAALIPAIEEADAADRKLTVGARVDATGRLLVLIGQGR